MVNLNITQVSSPLIGHVGQTQNSPTRRAIPLLLAVNLNTSSQQPGDSQREREEESYNREPILLENSTDKSPNMTRGIVSHRAERGGHAAQMETESRGRGGTFLQQHTELSFVFHDSL